MRAGSMAFSEFLVTGLQLENGVPARASRLRLIAKSAL
jgi:hypothetical protein